MAKDIGSKALNVLLQIIMLAVFIQIIQNVLGAFASQQQKVSVEEQYEFVERKKLEVTTEGTSYNIVTEDPKVLTLIADGDKIIWDIKEITDDSPILFDGGTATITLNSKRTTVYAKSTTSPATLYIQVFK